jgi:hypothetical protein
MMTLFLSLALAGAAVENPPAEGATTTQPAKPAKPKKICKTVKMTGSNLGKRTCKTQDQWNGDQDASIDAINQGYKQNTGVGDSPLGN